MLSAVNLKKVEPSAFLTFFLCLLVVSGCTYVVMLGYDLAAESFFQAVQDDKYFSGGFISVW